MDSRIFLRFKPLLTVNTHETHQNCGIDIGLFGCFTISHQISRQHIDRKILLLKKIKISRNTQVAESIFG